MTPPILQRATQHSLPLRLAAWAQRRSATTGQTALNLSLGNALDTLNVTSTAAGAATTVRTGTAGTTANVHSTTGALAVISGAADTVNVGDTAGSGLLSLIAGNVNITGLGK